MLGGILAEREGFEPSVQLPVRVLSKDVPSATRPPFLLEFNQSYAFKYPLAL